MFNSKKKQQKLIEQVNMIKPTSKVALKQQCLMLCNLKVEEADKMYDFLMKDLVDSIPDIEPSQRSFIQNIGDSANGVLGWVRENKDVLSQVVGTVKDILSKGKTSASVTPLPPINGE